jgi:hypothetical protein
MFVFIFGSLGGKWKCRLFLGVLDIEHGLSKEEPGFDFTKIKILTSEIVIHFLGRLPEGPYFSKECSGFGQLCKGGSPLLISFRAKVP